MNVGSLFSGIGGIELGFERAGFKTAWFIEVDKFCQKILRKNFPKVPIYSDIRKINWKELPKVDILTGGFPCQDISIAGKNKGIKGKRSGLWGYYIQAIRDIQPRYAIIENVAILAKRGLNTILRDLAKAGYDAEWYCFTASEFGAPHKRERLFIIAYPNKIRRNNSIYFEQDHEISSNQEWNTQKDWETWRDLAFRTSKNIRTSKWKDNHARVCGMDNGIPNWMDRIGSLGNSVVPQIAEYISRRIKQSEGESK